MAYTATQLAQMGYGGYAGWGDAEANADYLATGGSGKRTSGAPTAMPQLTPRTTTPQVTQPMPTVPPAQPGIPTSAQQLVQMGYQGYTGWGDAEAIADFKATNGSGKGSPINPMMGGQTLGAAPTIDLVGLYNSLYKQYGLGDIEQDIVNKTKAFNDRQLEINDNPFLSEASRVGKLQKLQLDFNNSTQLLRDQISSKKADLETMLNLQMKQFDINSEQARQSLQQFNTLLSTGALNNASPEDIANLVRSTGMSSAMIQSAIDFAKKSQTDTQIISYDDGQTQGFVTVDQNTGEIINRQVIAASGSRSGSGTAGEREAGRVKDQLVMNVKNGMTLGDAISLYGDSLSLADITQIYNQYSIYGPAKESGSQIQRMYLESKKLPKESGVEEGSISPDGKQIYLNGQWITL